MNLGCTCFLIFYVLESILSIKNLEYDMQLENLNTRGDYLQRPRTPNNNYFILETRSYLLL